MANDSISTEIKHYTACEKIDVLVKAYDNDFEQVKLKPINSKISQL